MSSLADVKRVLDDALQLGPKAQSLQPSTRLFGAMPELDSMSIVTVLLALEDHFGFEIEDDEVGAETFETVGSLTEFVDGKLMRSRESSSQGS
jgi:acyl carrier protein